MESGSVVARWAPSQIPNDSQDSSTTTRKDLRLECLGESPIVEVRDREGKVVVLEEHSTEDCIMMCAVYTKGIADVSGLTVHVIPGRGSGYTVSRATFPIDWLKCLDPGIVVDLTPRVGEGKDPLLISAKNDYRFLEINVAITAIWSTSTADSNAANMSDVKLAVVHMHPKQSLGSSTTNVFEPAAMEAVPGELEAKSTQSYSVAERKRIQRVTFSRLQVGTYGILGHSKRGVELPGDMTVRVQIETLQAAFLIDNRKLPPSDSKPNWWFVGQIVVFPRDMYGTSAAMKPSVASMTCDGCRVVGWGAARLVPALQRIKVGGADASWKVFRVAKLERAVNSAKSISDILRETKSEPLFLEQTIQEASVEGFRSHGIVKDFNEKHEGEGHLRNKDGILRSPGTLRLHLESAQRQGLTIPAELRIEDDEPGGKGQDRQWKNL